MAQNNSIFEVFRIFTQENGFEISSNAAKLDAISDLERIAKMNRTISIVFHYGDVASTSPPPSQSPQSIALEAAAGIVRACSKHGYAMGVTVVDMDGATQVDFRDDGATVSVIKPGSGSTDTAPVIEPIFDF